MSRDGAQAEENIVPRKMLDCRNTPSVSGCTLTISGEPDELLEIAIHHMATTHGHTDTPELREQVRQDMYDAPFNPPMGTGFVQLIEFTTDQFEQMQELEKRWEEEIGSDSAVVWEVSGQDRDNPRTYVSIVGFRDYDQAMVNSAHPATDDLARQMAELAEGKPTFHNLDVKQVKG